MRFKIERNPAPSGDWPDRVLVVWEEDDAPVPDKERLGAAWVRITGHRLERAPLRVVDRGDWIASLYPDGWVRIASCEGGAVGVVVQALD